MKCDRYGLIRYIRGELDLQEIEVLTAHLEQCAECTAELRLLARLRANREEWQRAVRPQDRTRGNWPRRYLWAAAAMILLALGLLLVRRTVSPQAEDIALLATAGLPGYEPMVLRQGKLPERSVFEAAMESYRAGDLSAAEAGLRKRLQQVPLDSDALFYLGAIYHYRRDYAEAGRLIQEGLRGCTLCPRERYHWYLAQIAMKKRNGAEARRQLGLVAELKGQYAEEAQRILSLIP